MLGGQRGGETRWRWWRRCRARRSVRPGGPPAACAARSASPVAPAARVGLVGQGRDLTGDGGRHRPRTIWGSSGRERPCKASCRTIRSRCRTSSSGPSGCSSTRTSSPPRRPGCERTTYGEWAERTRRLGGVLDDLGISARRPGRHLRLEHGPPPRAVLRRAVHRPGAAHPQHPAVPRAARLHREPRRGRGDLRRPVAARRCCGRSSTSSRRSPHRGDGRRQGRGARARRAGIGAPRLRGPAGRRRARSTSHVDDENRAAVDVLHERHHGQPQGRRVLAPLDLPAHDGGDAGRRASASREPTRSCRSCRCSTPTPGAWPTPRVACRRHAGDARARPVAAGDRRPDRGGAGHASPPACPRSGWACCPSSKGRDIVEPAAPSRAAARPCPRRCRRRYREQIGLPILQAWGMTETSPIASVGPHQVARSTPSSTTTSRPTCAPRSGSRRRRRRAAIVEPGSDRGAAVGRRDDPASCRCAGRGSRPTYYNDDARPPSRSPRTAGCKTGDVAVVDHDGYIRLVDRTKDVIKSGGEWICSVELENELMAPPEGRRGRGDRRAAPEVGRAPAGVRRRQAGRGAHQGRGARRSSPRRSPSGGCPTTWSSSTRSPRRPSASSPRRTSATASPTTTCRRRRASARLGAAGRCAAAPRGCGPWLPSPPPWPPGAGP